MVLSCCAYRCTERQVTGGSVTFHSFPKDPVRRKLWEVKTRRADFKATDYTKICSKHFTPKSFDLTKLGGTWLKANAVPTIFDFGENSKEGTIVPDPNEPPSSDDERVYEDWSRRKRLHFFGDFDESDMTSPTKAQAFHRISHAKFLKCRQTIQKLSQRNKRLKKRVASLNAKLSELKEKKRISDGASAKLKIPLNVSTDSKLKTTSQNSSMSCSESDFSFSLSDINSDFTDSEEVPSAFGPDENAEADFEEDPSDVPLMTAKIVQQEQSSSRTTNPLGIDSVTAELIGSVGTQETPEYIILADAGFSNMTGLSDINFSARKKELDYIGSLNSGDSLFNSPALIKEEPVTFEEESLDFKS